MSLLCDIGMNAAGRLPSRPEAREHPPGRAASAPPEDLRLWLLKGRMTVGGPDPELCWRADIWWGDLNLLTTPLRLTCAVSSLRLAAEVDSGHACLHRARGANCITVTNPDNKQRMLSGCSQNRHPMLRRGHLQVLSRKHYDGEIADVWSCGVTLYVMLVGAYPFEDSSDPRNFRKTIQARTRTSASTALLHCRFWKTLGQIVVCCLGCRRPVPRVLPYATSESSLVILQRIMGVKYSFPANLRLSGECLDLIRQIFVANPAKRVTLKGLKQHPWFLQNLPDELKVSRCPTSSAQLMWSSFRRATDAPCNQRDCSTHVHQLLSSAPGNIIRHPKAFSELF